MDKEIISLIAIIVAMLLYIGFAIHLDYGDARDYKHYTVTDKDVKNYNNDSKYLIYTVDEDGEVMVFSVEDRFWLGRFYSSDDYAKIEVGKTYNFSTVGVRSGLFSTYPDIIEFKEVK